MPTVDITCEVEITPEVTIEVRVECQRCGREVETTIRPVSRYNPHPVIEVYPCENCENEAKDQAREEGRKDGYEDGFQDGRDDGLDRERRTHN